MMRVVLRAGSHPESGDIVIQDGLYAIGRREEPFSSMEGNGAAKLSRRHARIFVEGGTVYIVDLGSTNGTQVAGRLLGTEPAALSNGDEVMFGGEIMFRAEITGDLDEATVIAETPSIRLILTPEHDSLDPVVINSFPFLISRNDQWIRDYEDQFPEDVKELSRRHALIVLKGSRPYVEDLDSANGTFVSGVRLDELARALNDGDTLAFGTGHFAFKVQLDRNQEDRTVLATAAADEATRSIDSRQDDAARPLSSEPDSALPLEATPEVLSAPEVVPPEAAKPARQNAHPVDENPKTVYLDASATSFINEVYRREEAADDEEISDSDEPSSTGGRVGRLAKARAVSTGLREALDTKPSTGRRAALGAVVLAALVAGVFAVNYTLGADRRQVESLLEQGEYAASAVAANTYLQSNSNDQEVDALGARALLNAIVPDWLGLIESGDYERASGLIREAEQSHPNLSLAAEYLEILAWGSRVKAHMAERTEGSASLFKMGEEVRMLVVDWEEDVYTHRRLMGQLSSNVPAFEPVEAELTSTLRTLQNEKSLYLKAISDLRSAIAESLASGQTGEINSSILDFEVRFPTIRGTDPLRNDLARYQRLQEMVETGDLLAIRDFRNGEPFTTAVFAEYVDAWLSELLPPPEIVAQFETANQLWRAGDLGDAVATYQILMQTDWGDLAEMEIDRAQKVMNEFQDLQNAREAADYTQRLLEFRNELIPGRDDYFVQALRSEIGTQEEALRSRLEQLSAVARTEWEAFERNGGIPSVLRLQGTLTESYRVQATRLMNSLTAIVEATDAYPLIAAQSPPEWLQLRVDVVNEIVRQRRALEGLKRVMDRAVVESKLALLPQIEESV